MRKVGLFCPPLSGVRRGVFLGYFVDSQTVRTLVIIVIPPFYA